jgi:nitrite reductase (NO-forming)
MADKNHAITTVITGLSGPIKVNGKDFNGVMPPVAINDEQVAQVLTYVRNEWGNTGDIVTVDEVRKVRAESAH